MRTKEYTNWLKQYYGNACGMSGINIDDLAERPEVQNAYVERFQKPIMKILGTNDFNSISPDTLSNTMNMLNNSKLKGWMYVLPEFVEGYYTQGKDTANSVRQSVSRFINDTIPIIVGSAVGNDYVRYVTADGHDYYIGEAPRDACFIGPFVQYRAGVNNIKLLASKNPWLLLDNEVDALRACVNELQGDAKLDEKELKKETISIPTKDGMVMMKTVNALSEELPPYSVRQLIDCLSDSDIQKHNGNAYLAAYEYMMEHKNLFPFDDLNYIRTVVSSKGSQSDDTLDPDSVLAFINHKFGTSFATLDEVVHQHPMLSVYDPEKMSDNTKNMTIGDLIKSEEVEPEMCGTLDELLNMYVEENDLDDDCTIRQLLEAMTTGIKCEPISIKDNLSIYVKAHNVRTDMSLQEFLTGQPLEQTAESIADYIAECPYFDKFARTEISNSIRRTSMFQYPDIIANVKEYIESCKGLPDLISKALLDNLENGTDIPATLKVFESSDEQAVADIAKDKIVEYIRNCEELPDDARGIMISNFMNGTHTSINHGRVIAVDQAYEAAEHILRSVREALSKDDSYDNRKGMVGMVYAFTRLLMYSNVKADEKANVIEFLEGKAKQCSPKYASVIQEAISKLK